MGMTADGQAMACRRKRYYPDDASARAGAKRRIDKGYVTRLWVYRCTCCDGWHLTSHPQPRWCLVTNETPDTAHTQMRDALAKARQSTKGARP